MIKKFILLTCVFASNLMAHEIKTLTIKELTQLEGFITDSKEKNLLRVQIIYTQLAHQIKLAMITDDAEVEDFIEKEMLPWKQNFDLSKKNQIQIIKYTQQAFQQNIKTQENFAKAKKAGENLYQAINNDTISFDEAEEGIQKLLKAYIECMSLLQKDTVIIADNQETTQLINGFKKALDQKTDLDKASLTLLEKAIESRCTHGKMILNTLLKYKITYWSLLKEAVVANNIALVEHLLKATAANNSSDQSTKIVETNAGSDLNYHDDYDMTMLTYAAKRNYFDIVRLLITYGAYIDEKGRDHTALHYAADFNYFDIAYFLVTHSANVNSKNYPDYNTPLHLAVSKGYFDIALLLIDHGANIDEQNEYGYTALHEAAGRGFADIVDLLIARGANIHIKNGHGQTALHEAASDGFCNIALTLINHGADVNAQNKYGETPLQFAADENYTYSIKSSPDVVRLLLDHGANINHQNKNGDTALHMTVCKRCDNWSENGYPDTIRLLLDRGVNVNIKNKYNATALHIAAYNNHADGVSLLINHNADVNLQNQFGWTPLHGAVYNKNPDMIRSLIIYGANQRIKNNEGKTALDIANPEMKKVIEQALNDRKAR